MSYRDNLQALVDRHDALDADVVRAKKQRDELRQMIDSAQARLRLPVLDHIKVAAPCKEDWATMSGDERARHCLRCNQNVYNLSNMTREEAEALLIAKEGKLCVRYYRRSDGTILTKNCPVGAQRRRRWWVGIGVMATLIGAIFGFLSTRKKHEAVMGDIGGIDDDKVLQGEVIMGKFEDSSPRGGHEGNEIVNAPEAPETAEPHVGMRLP